jgi:hypothetical protein
LGSVEGVDGALIATSSGGNEAEVEGLQSEGKKERRREKDEGMKLSSSF